MRKTAVTALLVMPILLAFGAQAQEATAPSPTPAPYYSTSTSKIGDLLANPETKAVLEQDIPKVIHDDRIGMGTGMTLKEIQPYAGPDLTDEILAKVDSDLAKVPGPK
jgi:hypothetical protein